uniref:Uncharacterized protein n=1 Tax=Arundo donax TaxID=35708 RepID=A0A0A9DVX4_ARUDO
MNKWIFQVQSISSFYFLIAYYSSSCRCSLGGRICGLGCQSWLLFERMIWSLGATVS